MSLCRITLPAAMILLSAVGGAAAASTTATPASISSRSPVPLPPAICALLDLLEAWARAHQLEAVLAALVALALLNVWYGALANRQRILQISDVLFAPDPDVVRGERDEEEEAADAPPPPSASSLTFLARHFYGHGYARSPNPALWWYESLNHAVLWASGRKGLDGALIAVETKPRQDILHRLGVAQLFSAVLLGGAALEPREGDILLPGSSGEGLLFDGFVDADTMPWRGCLVIGTRSCLRALAKKFPVDVGTIAQAHAIDPATTTGGGGAANSLPYAWPSADLGVLTDQPQLFQALLSAPRVAAILGDPAQAQLVRKHLRFVHVTSDFPGRNPRRLTAEVKLPASAARLRDAEPALEFVMALADSLSAFRQSPEARKRADDAREAANAAHQARLKARASSEGGGGAGRGRGRGSRGGSEEHAATQLRAQKLRQERLTQEREKAKKEGRLDEWEREQRKKAERKMMKRRAIKA
jgi:hypothetical protein